MVRQIPLYRVYHFCRPPSPRLLSLVCTSGMPLQSMRVPRVHVVLVRALYSLPSFSSLLKPNPPPSCRHHIRENLNGLCPACRTPYNADPHAFSAVDRQE